MVFNGEQIPRKCPFPRPKFTCYPQRSTTLPNFIALRQPTSEILFTKKSCGYNDKQIVNNISPPLPIGIAGICQDSLKQAIIHLKKIVVNQTPTSLNDTISHIHKLAQNHTYTIQLFWIFTHGISTKGNVMGSICLSSCFQSIFWTDWSFS